MVPVIGITSFDEHKNRSIYVSININYPYSVSIAGGLPFVLPGPSGLAPEGRAVADLSEPELARFAEAYAASLDGLILSGGGDVCPYLYGEQASKAVARMDADRDRWELALFSAAYARRLPVLGICRGCQLVNVALGGTLWQDIPSQIPGAQGHSFDVPMSEPSHHVDFIEGTRTRDMFPERRVLANSFHHQSVKDVAPGLAISALAPDGVIEAVESDDPARFLVAVQFHPEGMTRRYQDFRGPFSALVKAAGDFRATR